MNCPHTVKMAKKDGSKAHQQLAGGRKNASIMSFVTKKSDPIDDVAQQRNESISPPDVILAHKYLK